MENTPPTYYVGLHGVLVLSNAEWAMRLPSALAALLLVAAIYWVGLRVAGRVAGVLAALLGALSPFVLEYAQLARAYVFAMLLCTLAAGCLLEWQRSEPGSRRRVRWLALGAVPAVAAVWVHYAAALVLALLVFWALLSSRGRGERLALGGLAALVGLGGLAVMPHLIDSLDEGNATGVTRSDLVEMIGAPFDGRYGAVDLTVGIAIGAVVIVAAAAAALWAPWAREAPLLRTFAVPLALLPLLGLVGIGVLGPEVLVTRYAAPGVPIMLVLVAGVIALAPRLAAVPLAALALAAGLWGSIAAHTDAGQYPDVRSGARDIAAQRRAGDVVAIDGTVSIGPLFEYYAERAGMAGIPVLHGDGPGTIRALREAPRVWLVRDPPVSSSALEGAARGLGLQVERVREFPANADLQLSLLSRPPGR